ncbi:MAG: hypothetical protein KDI09_22230 [Halioglobus sp.]|nr:hypothetical protein [Halioglobus sp.]
MGRLTARQQRDRLQQLEAGLRERQQRIALHKMRVRAAIRGLKPAVLLVGGFVAGVALQRTRWQTVLGLSWSAYRYASLGSTLANSVRSKLKEAD